MSVPFPYKRVIKRAWEITWKHKYLWFFGFFSYGGSGGCNGGFNMPMDQSSMGSLNEFEIALMIGVGALVLLFAITALILSWVCTGGLVDRVRHIAAGNSSSFGETWQAGKTYFGRIFRLWLLVLALVLCFMLLIGLCVGIGAALYFTINEVLGIVIGALIGLMVMFAFMATMVLLMPIMAWGLRFIVLEDMQVIPGLKAGWGLTKRKPGPTVLNILIMIGFGMGFAVASMIVLCPFMIGAIALMVGTQSYLSFLVMLPGMVLLFPLIAGFKTYSSSFYTLAFMELRNIEHLEVEQTVIATEQPLPEPVG
ncbi:MAG: hypothetical protein P9M14_18710 [Candidatus Alcyoniella australis]|nr:hypothetical protein [Candidatus Alcyoniella australis]